jgi:hypothetical protein
MNATFDESGDQHARGEPATLSFALTACTANTVVTANSIKTRKDKRRWGCRIMVLATEVGFLIAGTRIASLYYHQDVQISNCVDRAVVRQASQVFSATSNMTVDGVRALC